MLAWFAWMSRTHEVSDSNASSLRTGVRNVLTIDPAWESADMVGLDVDGLIQRFRNAKRGTLSDASVEEYARRFRQSIEAYRRWLDGDKDWNPVRVRSVSGPSRRTATRRTPAPAEESSSWAREPSRPVALEEDPELIRHTVPLRSGEDAVLHLPRDLSPADARRIGRVVAALALDDEHDESGR
jgi:hypothetical protein